MSSPEIPELSPPQILEVAPASPRVRACPCSWVPNRVFARFPNQQISEVRTFRNGGSGLPRVHDFASSPNRNPRTLHIREFETSQVSDFLDSRIPCSWKTYFENAIRLRRFEGDVFSWIPQQLCGYKLCFTKWEFRCLELLNYGVIILNLSISLLIRLRNI
jgi:hypothetical protein